MSRFWSDHVANLAPYVAGEQPKLSKLVKLNTNENPYGPSPRALEAIRAATGDRLRLYPDNESTVLRAAIAAHHGVEPGQVFVGNGSDEILAHVFNGLFRRNGRVLLMPDITYSFYKTYCRLYDVPAELVPLDDEFAIRVGDYTAARTEPIAGIILANPNAPTGRALSLDEIEAIAKAHPDAPVVIDEAYVDFGAESAIALLGRCANIVAIHTFSKSRSLAGLRVGFAVGGTEIIDGLNRVKDSFNSYPLDSLAHAGATAAIEDVDYFDRTRNKVMETRAALTQRLETFGFKVLPSRANFVFASHPDHDGSKLAAALRAEGVLVRHFSQPRIDQFLRITVGTPEECELLCKTLVKILTKTH